MSQKLKTNLNVDNLSGLFYIDYKDIFILFIKLKGVN